MPSDMHPCLEEKRCVQKLDLQAVSVTPACRIPWQRHWALLYNRSSHQAQWPHSGASNAVRLSVKNPAVRALSPSIMNCNPVKSLSIFPCR